MQAALSNLISALLVIQSLTGWCCCSYPCDPRASETAKVTESRRPPCCDQCDDESRQAPKPNAPCRCHECLGFWVYVPTDRAQVDCSQLVVPFGLQTFAPIQADSHLSGVFFVERAGGPPVAGPPLRLHLLHQIILI